MPNEYTVKLTEEEINVIERALKVYGEYMERGARRSSSVPASDWAKDTALTMLQGEKEDIYRILNKLKKVRNREK